MSDLKPGWRRVKFGEIAECVNDRVDDPKTAGVARYVGLEHLVSDSLSIRRWGTPDDVESTKLRFKPGDIIFGKRRAYQRKLAVADFEGICSAHAMVLRAKSRAVLPEFLPFFMQSDVFMGRAVAISVGSLSPTINWKNLAAEEFALPPLEEQRRIMYALQASASVHFAVEDAEAAANKLAAAFDEDFFASAPTDWARMPVSTLCELRSRRHQASDRQLGVNADSPGAVPVLRSLNVWPGRFDLSDLRYISAEGNTEQSKLQLRENDVLIVRTGDAGRPGNAAVVPVKMEGWNCLDIILARPHKNILAGFLEAALNRSSSLQRLTSLAPGTKQKHLTMTELHRLLIPVPPLARQRLFLNQRAIVRRAEEVAGQHRLRSAEVNRQLLRWLENANVHGSFHY